MIGVRVSPKLKDGAKFSLVRAFVVDFRRFPPLSRE